HGGTWFMGGDGCRIGNPGNLVVTPIRSPTYSGEVMLDMQHSGRELCSWLSTIEKAHRVMVPAWQEEHLKRRSNTSFWNLYRRFKLWRRSVPKVEFEVEIVYLDLWNKDRYGHPLPWAVALFRYKCPTHEVGYGLWDHLDGEFFSLSTDPMSPTEVHLLLQPRPGYNQPLQVEASNWQYLSGFVSGMRRGRTRDEREMQESWAWAASLYGGLKSFMTVSGKISDLWMNNGKCYFRWPLHVEWNIFDDTVCERLHRDANANVVGALKAAALPTVKIHVTGIDLFRYSRPVLWGVLDEGILSINAGTGILRLEIDTDPRNVPNFERFKSTAETTRAAGLVVKGMR
ncbi:uncharacterized protein LOC34621467, partial [Cyclospora cayetanensis]|uniref:Uncharacterized protein LOC34621467 n=1 Tax=Cyclospora cayetanensis TaxID=88456 RepID=A0A6P5WCR0_9EIME